jgi:hypothetical protein
MALQEFTGKLDETPKLKEFTGNLDGQSQSNVLGEVTSAIKSLFAPKPASVMEGLPADPAAFDFNAASRLSRKLDDLAQQPRIAATPQHELRAWTPPEPRSIPRAVADTVLGFGQGSIGMVKGVADNVNAGDNAVSNFLDSVIKTADKYKSDDLRDQQAKRNFEIYAAKKNMGETGAARAAFNSFFTQPAAGLDVVSRGAGSLGPTVGLGAFGAGTKVLGTVNALSNAGDAASQAADTLRNLTPEAWANDADYRALIQKGATHADAVAALVPYKVLPAQAAGAVTGLVSGSTGVEKVIAGNAVGNAVKQRVGRVVSELLGEQAETLVPQAVGNVTVGNIDGKTKFNEGLGQASIDTLAGTLPGAGMAGRNVPNQTPTQPQAATPTAADYQALVNKVFGNGQAAPVSQPQAAQIDPVAPTPQPVTQEAQQPAQSLAQLIANTATQDSPLNVPKLTPVADDIQLDKEPVADGTANVLQPVDSSATGSGALDADTSVAASQRVRDAGQLDLTGNGTTEPEVRTAPLATDGRLPQQDALANTQPAADVAAPVKQPSGAQNTIAAPQAALQSATAPQSTGYIGQDGLSIDDGGKPFKSKLAAQKAKKLQPMMRVKKVEGGFVLADKTPAQLAAEAKAAKRIRGANTEAGSRGRPMAAHEFIASRGGMAPSERSDLGIEGNVKIGNRWLFAGAGKGMTIGQATEALQEAGYIKEDSHNAAYELIKRSVSNPQYTDEGWERIAELERETQFEDYLASQQEAAQEEDFDPFAPLDDFGLSQEDATEFAQASPELQAEVAAYAAQLDALGIDAEGILERIAVQYPQATQDQYYEHAKDAFTQAIAEATQPASSGNAGQDGGEQGNPRGQVEAPSEEALSTYDQKDIEDRLAKLEQAEQERKRLDREAEQKAQADAERDTFTLTGSDRAADVAAAQGQQDIFSATNDTPAADPQAEAKTEPAPAKPARKPKDTAAAFRAKLEDHFAVGNIIKSDYWKTYNRVTAFDWNGGNWSVTEERVEQKDGDWVAVEGPRSHSTAPSKKDVVVERAEQQQEPENQDDQKITDLGEKIGGARKDTATSTGRTGRTKSKDERPAWARRYEVSQIAAGDSEGRWVIHDMRSKDFMGQPKQVGGRSNTFATEQEANEAIPLAAVSMKHRAVPTGTKTEGGEYQYEIWRDINDRKRVKVVDQVFDSRIAALEYMAKNAQEILETNTTFGEADLPTPDRTDREGVARREGDVQGKDFMDAFGFRGVEFGNWNNQIERQEVMNAAYDGLMDLAEVIGLPPKAIGLNGDLALAFGARGQGLSSARAHYEQERSVINLTKMNGAGALAHEWFHALDHYLARQDGKASSQWKVLADGTRTFDVRGGEHDMASSGFKRSNSGVRQELRDAYNNVMQTMFKKAEQYVEDTAKADKFVATSRNDVAERLDALRKDLSEQKDVRYYKRNNKPASAEQLAEFDTIAKQLVQGEALETGLVTVDAGKSKNGMRWSNEALEKLSAIYKAVRGRSGFDATNQSGVMDRLRGDMMRYSQRLKMLAEAQSGAEKTKSVPTEFAMSAKELDQGRGQDYWTTPHEMAARAFQGYVEDKIAALGARSPFLNYAPENFGLLTPWGAKRPYPYGQERVAINKAFDEFVNVMETKATEKGVAIFSRTGNSVEALVEKRLSPSAIEDQVENLIAQFGHKPDIRIIDTAIGVMPGANDGDGVSGAVYNGKIYLFRDQLATSYDVQRTLFHELFHYGLRRFLTREQFTTQMLKLYERDADAKQFADQWLKSKDGKETAAKFGEKFAKARGVDEALATLGEVNQGEFVNDDWVNKAKVTVTRWLAQLADFLGFKSYATKLRTMKNEESRTLIKDIFGRLKADAPAARNAWSEMAEPAFAKKDDNTDQTELDLNEPGLKLEPVSAKDAFSLETNAAGRKQWTLGRKLYDNMATVATEYLGRVKLADNQPAEFKQMMRQFRVDQNKATESAKAIAEKGMELTPEQRVLLSDLIEKQGMVGDVPPQEMVELAASITAALETQARDLIELGMLSEDRLVKDYLPRLYKTPLVAHLTNKQMFMSWFTKTRMKIRGARLQSRGLVNEVPIEKVELAKKFGWKVSSLADGDNLPQNLLDVLELGGKIPAKFKGTKVVMWRDFTQSEREDMGEVRDAVLRYAMGYVETQRDVAIGRLFKAVASNPDLAKTFNPGGWVQVPNTEIKGAPGTKTYGALAGMYVEPQVADSLKRNTQPKGVLMAAYDKALGWWKEGKTVWNPVSHGNNVVSNVFVMHFAGLNPANPANWRDTVREYRTKGQYYKEAVDKGLFGTEWATMEIQNLLMPDLKDMADIESVASSRVSKVAEFLKKTGKPVSWYRENMQRAYEFEDQFFKLMIYADRRKAGMTPEQAIEDTERYIFNYADLPEGIENIKRVYSPFFSYTYKAVPMVIHTAMTRPDRLLVPIALLSGANWLGYLISGGDEDKERKGLPDYMQGRSAIGTQKAIRMPFDVEGKPAFMDVTRRVPLGDLFDVNNQTNGLPVPAPLMPSHPLLSMTAAIAWNVDTFSGKDLVKKSDTAWEAAQTRAGYVYKQLTPNAPFVPGSYNFNKLMDSAAYTFDTEFGPYTGRTKAGDPVPLSTTLPDVFTGTKIRAVDPERGLEYKRADIAKEVREVQANIRSANRNQSMTADSRERYNQEQRDKLDELRKQREALQ